MRRGVDGRPHDRAGACAMATQTSTHTEVPSGAKAAFPPFQKETFASQLVWLAITFVALYLLISRIAVPRIGGILEERGQAHRGRLRGGAADEGRVGGRACGLREVARRRAQPRAGDRQRDPRQAPRRGARSAARRWRRSSTPSSPRPRSRSPPPRPPPWRTCAASRSMPPRAIVERLIGTAPAAPAVAAAVDDALKR